MTGMCRYSRSTDLCLSTCPEAQPMTLPTRWGRGKTPTPWRGARSRSGAHGGGLPLQAFRQALRCLVEAVVEAGGTDDRDDDCRLRVDAETCRPSGRVDRGTSPPHRLRRKPPRCHPRKHARARSLRPPRRPCGRAHRRPPRTAIRCRDNPMPLRSLDETTGPCRSL